jgi:membrane-bound serine protease (ClpP class)
MRLHLCIGSLGLTLASLLTPFPAAGADETQSGPVYVIPVKGMIERGLVYVVRRGVAQAIAQNASAIILDMDTPGGRLDAAEEIIKTIGGLKIKTLTYVNPSAISAGAIIAMGTDDIYMAPGSRIGDAMPLMLSPFGAPQEMPEALEEKAVSYVASLIRSAAQRKQHDPKLAEAMVRRDMEYKIGDEVISAKGQLLTLTNVEAERLVGEEGKKRPLLSLGTVASLTELRERIGARSSRVVELTVTPAETIARYIEMLSVLFLIGGLLGLYIEFKTPGFGLPGILGILLLAIWFWGHHVAGLAGMGELVLFVVGMTLLLVEIFVIPGFGIVGVTGIALMVAALLMAMVEHYPSLPWYEVPGLQLQVAVVKLGTAIIVAFIGALVLVRYLPATRAFQHIALGTTIGREAGYQASASTDTLVGLRGQAATPLRPAGVGVFGGRRLTVVSRGDFIDAGAPIVVAEAHGNRIVVEKAG